MIRRILVPLDGSPRAEGILPHVLSLAKVFRARVDLLHVISGRGNAWTGSVSDPLTSRLARADRSGYLDARARELGSGGLEVRTRVEEGAAAETIVDLLRGGAYDAVCLTAHGAGDDRNLRIGCSAVSVILNCSTSVFLVPGCPPAGKGMGGFTVPYRRVVVPVDCSPRSDWSLALAAAVARGCGASLKVVHVLDRPQVLSRLPSSGAAERLVNRLVEMNRVEAQRYLEQAVWRLGGRGLKVEAQILDPSAPEAAVGDLASASDSDLVVLSAHGRGASADLPFGGNAAKMIFWGRSPVLVLQDLPVKRRFSEEPTRLEGTSRLARALRAEHQITAQPQ